jgi:MGT family glycosyltransferase
LSERPRRFFLGAFGQPGHAFPMLALGAELVTRGHEVVYETWTRWREPVEAHGMRFVAAPQYAPETPERPRKPYEAVVMAAAQTREALAAAEADLVVHDILTLAPSLAAELEGVPTATLIPHVYPVSAPGMAPYAAGARIPRTWLGRAAWRRLDRLVDKGLSQGREELNGTRRRLGLGPVDRFHGGQSQELVLVGTLPELEYPRDWPDHVHVVGPLIWEPPYERVDPPEGDAPLVLVAPSTAQDPDHRLLRAALQGLGEEPVRVLATWNRRPLPGPERVPANTRLVEWISYAQTMPGCALVICHAGHGTMARALVSGAAVLAVPHAGDMAENAARVDWARLGVRLPWGLLGPRTLAAAVRRALDDDEIRGRARRLAAGTSASAGAARAADLVEAMAGARPGGGRLAGATRRAQSASA